MKKYTKRLIVSIVAAGMITAAILAVNYYVFAWSEPSLPPPQSLGPSPYIGKWDDGDNPPAIHYSGGAGGFVGIASSAPQSTLTVQQFQAGDTLLNITLSTGESVFFIDDTGNVSIGNAYLSEKLNIDGNLLVDGDVIGDELCIGSDTNCITSWSDVMGGYIPVFWASSTNNGEFHLKDNNNRVGIGITDPSDDARLHIVGGDHTIAGQKFSQQLWVSSIDEPADRLEIGYLYDGGADIYGRLQAYDGVLGIARPLILNESGGNVGIGTVYPNSILTLRQQSGSPDPFLNLILESTGNSTFYVSGSGDVGLGTEAPTEKLDVVGNIRSNNIITGSGLCFDVDCKYSWAQVSGSGGTATFWASSTGNPGEFFSLNPADRVGIGTVPPYPFDNVKLHIKGRDDTNGPFAQQVWISSNDDDNGRLEMGYRDDGPGNKYARLQAFDEEDGVRPLIFNESGGYIGIGTPTPEMSLHIMDDDALDDAGIRIDTYVNNVGLGTLLDLRRSRGSFDTPADVLAGDTLFNAYGFGWLNNDWRRAVDLSFLVDSYDSDGSDDNLPGRVVISVNDGDDPFPTGNSMISLRSNGNVGIGIPDPTQRLQVNGNILSNAAVDGNNLCIRGDCKSSWAEVASVTGFSAFWASTTPGEFFSLYPSQRLGIGTVEAAAATKVHIQGSDDINYRYAQQLWVASDDNPDGRLEIGYRYDNGYGNQYGRLQAYEGNTGTVRPLILNESGGNVGIGTTSPNRNLHIYDLTQNAEIDLQSTAVAAGHWGIYHDSPSDDLRFWKDNQDRLTITDDGNLGIGTTSPFKSLSVNGDLYVEGTITCGGGCITPGGNPGTVQYNAGGGQLAGDDLFHWDYLNRRLGLGTTNPAQMLHVNGNIQADGDISANQLCFGADCRGSWEQATGGFIAFWASTTGNPGEFHLKTDTDRVGIGTTNPDDTTRLHITGPDDTDNKYAQQVLVSSNDSFAGRLEIGYLENGGSERYGRLQAYDTGMGAVPLVLNDRGGNVGIGTTSPNRNLHIYDTAQNAEIDLQSTAAAASHWGIYHDSTSDNLRFWKNGQNRLTITNAGNVGIGLDDPGVGLDVIGRIRTNEDVRAGTGLCIGVSCITRWTDVMSVGGIATFWASTSDEEFFSKDSSHRVGIGTTDPEDNAKLHIRGADDTNGPYAQQVWISSDELAAAPARLEIGYRWEPSYQYARLQAYDGTGAGTVRPLILNESGGNVGIGTTTPNQNLHIYDLASNAEIDLQSISGAGNHWGIYHDSPSDDLRFWKDNDDRLTITDDGKVGIGTTTPINGSTLHIVGDDRSPYARQLQISSDDDPGGGDYQGRLEFGYVYDSGPDEYGRIQAYDGVGAVPLLLNDVGGNVGVGTTSPYQKLSVAGNLHVDGNITCGGSGCGGGGTGLPGGSVGTVQFNLDNTNFGGDNNLFWDNGNDRLGIGTPSPGSALEIVDDSSPVLYVRSSALSGTDIGIKIRGARGSCSACNISYIDFADWDNDEGGGTDFTMARIVGGMADNSGQTGYLKFNTNSGIAGSGLTEKMRIEKDGTVGIGTPSPDSRAMLHIEGPDSGPLAQQIWITSTDDPATGASRGRLEIGYVYDATEYGRLQAFDNTTQHDLVLNPDGGNVGIGTTTPEKTLSLEAPAGSGQIGMARFSVDPGSAPLDNGSDFGILGLNNLNAVNRKSVIAFQHQGAPKWEMGNDIHGRDDQDFFIWDNDAGTARFYIDPSGKVGIGTIVPTNDLHVVGDIYATGNIISGVSGYQSEDHDDVFPSAAMGALNEKIVMYNTTVEYGTTEADTRIYKNGSEILNLPTPTVGTFAANAGDRITSSKPIGLIDYNQGWPIPPISAAGTKHVFYSNRFQPHEIIIYAPYTTAKVAYHFNEYQDASPASTVTVQPGQIQTISTSNDNGPHRFYSTAPVVIVKRSTGGTSGDYIFIPPASREVLHSQSTYRYMTEAGTMNCSGGNDYCSSDVPMSSTAIGDGQGSDADMGLPYKMLGDTYVITHVLADYAIVSVEPNTIRVYQYSGGGTSFASYAEYDHTAASRSNPVKTEVGNQAGTDPTLPLTPPILVVGTAPFYLRTNDTTHDDEYPVIGYRQSLRQLVAKDSDSHVSLGGSGSSAGANGTVQFSDGSGGFLGNASEFHWDNANGWLGIGTTTPTDALHIVGSATEESSSISLTGASDNQWLNPSMGFRRSRGTSINQLPVQAEDELFGMHIFGYNNNKVWKRAVDVTARVDGGILNNRVLGRLQFATNDGSQDSPITRMVIKNDGTVGIGIDTPLAYSTLHIVGDDSPGDYPQQLFISSDDDTGTLDDLGRLEIGYAYDGASVQYGRLQAWAGNDEGTTTLLLNPAGGDVQIGDNIYYDTQRVQLGIGTNNPDDILVIYGANRDVRHYSISSNSATSKADYELRRARADGPGGAPSIVQNGDSMGSIRFMGHDGTDFVEAVQIQGWVGNNVTAADDMPGKLEFRVKGDGAGASLATRMVINYNGNVGIGDTSPGYRLEVGGDINVNTNGSYYYEGSSGSCIGGACSSDLRLKTNINPLSGFLEKIDALEPVSFEFIDQDKYGSELKYGLIAQDVEKIFPDMVIDDNGILKIVYDTRLEIYLIQALKELRAEKNSEIEALKAEKDAEVETLRFEIKSLKDIICLDHPEADICQDN